MRKKYILELLTSIIGDAIKAELVFDRLQEEGLLVLGFGDAEVDQIVEKFKDTFGTTKVSKYDRFAAQRLAKKYGSPAVVGIMQLLADNSNEKFAPIVNNVAQLEEKFPSVLNFVRNIKGDETIDA